MSPQFQIVYAHEFQYKSLSGLAGVHPAIVVGLIGPSGEDDVVAIIDTGANYCLFDGTRAKSLGLDLSAGKRITLSGLSGRLQARLHRVTLEIESARFDCEVAFSEEPIGRELLGRHDLFDKVRFGFRQGRSSFYFHPNP
jgi:predicted aspartyl protease